MTAIYNEVVAGDKLLTSCWYYVSLVSFVLMI